MRVDHLVWYCPDLAEGERYFAGQTDCRPAYGGVHQGEGTHNSLLSLSDNTYVEILGRDPAQDTSCLDPELRSLSGSGLYHWAVGGADLGELRDKAIAAGLDASDRVFGGRRLPNGKQLRWTLFGIRNHGLGALVPFFIDWMQSEHPARSAPRGGKLVKLEALSPEPEKVREIYRILGFEIAVTPAKIPGLCAILEGRNGPLELRSFDPLPRGFVI